MGKKADPTCSDLALAPAPPAAPLVGLLQLLEFVSEPLQQIFHGQPPASFVDGLGLCPANALLHGLGLPANVIELPLQVAPLVAAALQRGLAPATLPPEPPTLGP